MSICAQVKKQTQQQTGPTKAVTIQFLNEKMNEESSGIYMVTDETWMSRGEIDRTEHYEYSAYQYQILEENKSSYLIWKARIKNFTGSGEPGAMRFTTVYHNGEIKIPISKISLVAFLGAKDTSYSTDHKITVKLSYHLIITTPDNNISVTDSEAGSVSYISFTFLPISNNDYADKLKKAIMNLKSFYKNEKDPF